jgi:hypothetical protein
MANSEVAAKGCGLLIGFCVIALAIAAFNGWILMLLQGAIAPHFEWETWSYGLSVLVAAGITFVGALFRGNRA